MPDLAQQVHQVYDFMCFYMHAHNPEGRREILLRDELKAVQDYLDIQRDIIGKYFYIDFAVSGNMMQYTTAPTTLLTLVKNAFKHGEIHAPAFPVRIAVDVQQDGYVLQVANRKRQGVAHLTSHGQGLKNLKRRMELLYAGQANIRIHETSAHFEISITIQYKHLKTLQS